MLRPGSALIRHTIVLAVCLGIGLVTAAQDPVLVMFLCLGMWPWSLLLVGAWGVAGIHAIVGGLIEARLRRSWTVGLAFVLTAVMGLSSMAMLSRAAWDHPTDAAMLREFRNHRREYEELLAMYRADRRLGRIAPDFTRPANFFSGDSLPPGVRPDESQLREVRRRCRRLHLEAGLEGYDEKAYVAFIRSARGLAISGSAKGFAWMAERPKLIVEDTDRYRPSEPHSFVAYRPIEGNWYVFYDVTY